MALKIKVKNPDFEKGVEMGFFGVLVKNGEEVELTDEQEAMLISNVGGNPRDAFKGNRAINISGSMSSNLKDHIPSEPPNVGPVENEGGES